MAILKIIVAELKLKMAPHKESLPKFILVGVSATFLTLALLFVFTEVAGIYYVLAGALSSQIAIIWNFIWHDNWTWGNRKKEKPLLKRFVAFEGIYITSIVANTLLLYIFTDLLNIFYIFSMLGAIGITFMYNYVMHSRITFKQHI